MAGTLTLTQASGFFLQLVHGLTPATHGMLEHAAKINTEGMQGGIKMARAGDTALQRFANTVLDSDMQREIEMYRSRLWV
jgi:hypothetical protein